IAVRDVLDGEPEAPRLRTAGSFAEYLVNPGINSRVGSCTARVGECENAELVRTQDLGAIHRLIEKRPLLLECRFSLRSVGWQRVLENRSVDDIGFELILIQQRLGFTNSFERLRGI